MDRRRVIETSVDAVLKHARGVRGGLCSYYHPDTGEKGCFMGGDSCLLSTAGILTALKELGGIWGSDRYQKIPEELIEHITGLHIGNGKMKGAFYTGSGSRKVMPNYTAHAIAALMDWGKHDDLVIEGLEWLLSVQMDSGGFPDTYERTGLVWRHNGIEPLWQSQIVKVLYRGWELSGSTRMKEAATRCYRWSLRSFKDNPDGGEIHPAGAVGLLEAALLLDDKDNARYLARWCASAISLKGLFHQYYRRNWRSPELDVMPTAHFGLVLMDNPEMGRKYDRLLVRIEEGILSAYIKDGGFLGLPGDDRMGHYVYTWDTAWAVRFLAMSMISQ